MADKLATAFTPVTNPSTATLVMLADPVTGERRRITIGQFFGSAPTATFDGDINAQAGNFVKAATVLTLDRTTTGGINTAFLFNGAAHGEIVTTGTIFRIRASAGNDLELGAGGSNSDFILDATTKAATFVSLAGAGVRAVVVDANGVMSAP